MVWSCLLHARDTKVVKRLVKTEVFDSVLDCSLVSYITRILFNNLVAKLRAHYPGRRCFSDSRRAAEQCCSRVHILNILPAHAPSNRQWFLVSTYAHIVPIFQPLVQLCCCSLITDQIPKALRFVPVSPHFAFRLINRTLRSSLFHIWHHRWQFSSQGEFFIAEFFPHKVLKLSLVKYCFSLCLSSPKFTTLMDFTSVLKSVADYKIVRLAADWASNTGTVWRDQSLELLPRNFVKNAGYNEGETFEDLIIFIFCFFINDRAWVPITTRSHRFRLLTEVETTWGMICFCCFVFIGVC